MPRHDHTPTAIVMTNMGGPATLADVQPFLHNLFADRDIIQLPLQSLLGPFIANRRTPRVRAHYDEIGGGSPILKWSRLQGEGMVDRLDQISPKTAPHRFYVAFRYTPPFAADVLLQMQADGIQRAVAFTQYPQFSCSTTGSSFNDLWRAARALGLEERFSWSVIDRWPTHPGFIAAVAETIRQGLLQFSTHDREDVLLLFSAHSLPLAMVNRGDPYPQEVGATVQAVMQNLGFSYPYLLCYQSAVGPVQWLGPSTEMMIRRLGKEGRRNVLIIPIAFTSDHIETLHEIDIEYRELALSSGIVNFKRAPALNDSPLFMDALADLAAEHLKGGESSSRQYRLRCPGCANPECRNVLNPIGKKK